jgi:hypothetical protein
MKMGNRPSMALLDRGGAAADGASHVESAAGVPQ